MQGNIAEQRNTLTMQENNLECENPTYLLRSAEGLPSTLSSRTVLRISTWSTSIMEVISRRAWFVHMTIDVAASFRHLISLQNII